MEGKIGKINSGPLATMLLAVVVNVANEMRTAVVDKFRKEKVMEIDLRNIDDIYINTY
jgi:hypothetical protein